jgi:hypothetical protein
MVKHWDEESHEVEINLENNRVTSVQTDIHRVNLA